MSFEDDCPIPSIETLETLDSEQLEIVAKQWIDRIDFFTQEMSRCYDVLIDINDVKINNGWTKTDE